MFVQPKYKLVRYNSLTYIIFAFDKDLYYDSICNVVGIALTLLVSKEVYHFKKMLKDYGNSSGAHNLSISSKELEPLVDEYEIALISLKDSVKNEIK